MNEPDRTAEFVDLLTKSSRSIYAFLMSLLRNSTDADDVYQDVCGTLWKKFDTFTPGTNFTAWACEVAYLKVLDYRKRTRRGAALLSDAFVAAVGQSDAREFDEIQLRYAALTDCLQKLREPDRELIVKRYGDNARPADLANERGVSLSAIHKALSRIYQALYECIERSLRREERL